MNSRPKEKDADRRFTLASTMEIIRAVTQVERFDLDPCADVESSWGLEGYFSGGLISPWFGNVFVNPPWSQIGTWVLKAWDEMNRPAGAVIASVVMLLPDNRQSTQWWQRHVERWRDGRYTGNARVKLISHYLPGRPRYGSPGDPTGALADSPPFGSMVLHWKRTWQ